jgi:hypothetical protein
MSKAVKKAISLPTYLAAEVEAIARAESKPLNAVIHDALPALKRSRLRGRDADPRAAVDRLNNAGARLEALRRRARW